jgi:hypothetical protein
LATQLLLEGPSLEHLLEKVHAEHGPKARIVSADRVRKGGLAGMFSKPWFEIGVELPGPDVPVVEVAAAAEPAPAAITVDALLNLADDADSAEVSTPSFGEVLAEATRSAPAVVPPAPRRAFNSEPKPAPWTIMDPVPAEVKPEPTLVTPEPATLPAPKPATRPAAKPATRPAAKPAPRPAAKPSARRASGPQLISDLPQVQRPTRGTPAPRAVAELTPALRSTQRAAAKRGTSSTGEPTGIAPAPRKPAARRKPAAATQRRTSPVSAPVRAANSDFSDVLVALPGRIVMVAGELPAALDVAGWVCRRMRVSASSMLVAGADVSGDHRRVNGPEHAATLAAELKAGDAPVVVVVDAPVGELDGGLWAAAMADALGADAVIAVVDATRKTADLRRHLNDLGTVRALAVHAESVAVDPNTVLDLGVPVMLVDGRPAETAKPALRAAS